MKKRNTFGLVSATVVILIALSFTFQSCDLTSQEESFENPYTQKTTKTFSQISESVFNNVADNIEGKSTGTITRDDIMRFANEGYKKWAKNNGAELDAFEAGSSFLQKYRQLKMKRGTNASQGNVEITDSLLAELDLTQKQKKLYSGITQNRSRSRKYCKVGT